MRNSRFKVLITILIAGGLLAAACSMKDTSPSRRPNIILISLDTLRADRLSCYGYTEHLTPCLDALAGESILFARAFTQFPSTLQSHATLFTSVYPSVHGLIQGSVGLEDNNLNPGLVLLAEIANNLGYTTIGITEGGFVGGNFGFSRGFDEYYDQRLDAAQIFGRAAKWLEKNPLQPFFMFLHTYETHIPYDPPEEYLPLPASEYDWEHKMVASYEYVDRSKKGELRLDQNSPDFLRKVNQLYDGEVLFVDREIGRLIDTLKVLNLYDDLLLIILSDHGESLGENGEFGHSSTGQNNLHVVLMIKFPAGSEFEEPRLVEAPVGLIDILPTILDYLLSAESELQPFQGTSFLPLIRKRGTSSRTTYSETGRAAVVQNERYKYLKTDNGREILYDLAEDPGETSNLLGRSPKDKVRSAYLELKDTLGRIQSENERLRNTYGPRPAASPAPIRRDELRALGYL